MEKQESNIEMEVDNNQPKPQLEKGNYMITVVNDKKVLKRIMVVNSEVYVDQFVGEGLAIDV